jgi:hypothetical protein
MSVETTLPQTTTGEPRERRWRFQFSIRSLLLFTLFAALVLTSLLMYRRLSDAERELSKLRREAGYLKVEDESLFHAIAVPCDEPLTWKWRVYLPKRSKYRWMLAYGDEIPQSGFPKNICYSFTDEQIPRSKGVEALVTVSIRNDPDPDAKRWIFSLAMRSAEENASSETRTTIPDDLMRKILQSCASETARIGQQKQETRKSGEVIDLVKCRLCEEISPNSWTISPNPQPGFGVWLEEIR